MFDLVIDAIFFVDVIINFLSSYFKNDGQLETSHKKVLYQYASTWFALDLFACIPTNLIEYWLNNEASIKENDNYDSLLRLARLPRLYRLLRIARLFKIFKIFKNY